MAGQKINDTKGPVWVDNGDGNDTITTGIWNDTIYAGNGNNSVNAGSGNNQIYSGSGNDTLIAGAGHDTIIAGDGIKLVQAGGGNNYVEFGNSSGRSVVTAGAGNDTVVVGNVGSLGANLGEGDNKLTAGNGNMTISTGAGDDWIEIGDGNSTVYANGGRNTVHAGNGNNEVHTGIGRSTISAGDGNDLIVVQGGNNYINAGAGSNTVLAGDGNDSIYTHVCNVPGDDYIDAGNGNNVISASGGSNTILSGSGNDHITATGTSKDFNYISSGAGNDRLCLGAANDTVVLGAGSDTLSAGGGNDRVIVTFGETAGFKKVLDGGSGTDTLVLRFLTAELQRADVQNDLALYRKHLADGKAGCTFQFKTMGLQVVSWEKLEIQIINEPPKLPDASQQSFSAKEDNPILANLLALVTDPNGDVLKLTDVQSAAHGQLTFSADGSVVYVPDANWSGTENLSYTVDDGHGGVSTGTVTFIIQAVADTPLVNLKSDGWLLDLTAALTDTDGSESLYVTLAGIPKGITLDKGSYDAATGLWTLQPEDLGQVKIIAPPGLELGNDTVLVATAHSVESSNGDTATATYTLYSIDDNTIVLKALPSASETIDGNGGFDTLVFDGMSNVDLTSLLPGSLRSSEKIDLGSKTSINLTLSAKELSAMTDAHKLFVDGDDMDAVVLTDRASWSAPTVQTVDSIVYDVYKNLDALLYVQQGVAVV